MYCVCPTLDCEFHRSRGFGDIVYKYIPCDSAKSEHKNSPFPASMSYYVHRPAHLYFTSCFYSVFTFNLLGHSIVNNVNNDADDF